MVNSPQTVVALFIIIGVIALSLFTEKTAKYFIGIGIFGVFFILSFILLGNLNTSMFVGIAVAIFIASIFDWVIESDLYSAMLIISLATIGYVLLAIVLTTLWQYYQFNVISYSENQLFQFRQTIINDYRQILSELRKP